MLKLLQLLQSWEFITFFELTYARLGVHSSYVIAYYARCLYPERV